MRIQIDFYTLPRNDLEHALDAFTQVTNKPRPQAELILCRAGRFWLDVSENVVSLLGEAYAAGQAYGEIYAAREQATTPRKPRGKSYSTDYQLPNVILPTYTPKGIP